MHNFGSLVCWAGKSWHSHMQHCANNEQCFDNSFEDTSLCQPAHCSKSQAIAESIHWPSSVGLTLPSMTPHSPQPSHFKSCEVTGWKAVHGQCPIRTNHT
eukprot:1085720-Amphidinium_carterae.1